MMQRNFFARVGTPRCGVRGVLTAGETYEGAGELPRCSDGAARRPYL